MSSTKILVPASVSGGSWEQDTKVVAPAATFGGVAVHARCAEIDGLRSVAIVLVMLFHAFPDWCPGGFVGVDVFFVISGYLITRILMQDLARGQFTLRGFYARRALRILPALIAVLVVCYGVGWCVLLASEMQALGKHMAAGAGFVSNWVLWSEAGYFDWSSESKPLLHLWSLSVEEQFYLFWPVMLLLVWHWKPRAVLLLIGGLSLASLLSCIQIQTQSPVAAFYLPMTRFWELMAGAGVAAWQGLRPLEGVRVLGRPVRALANDGIWSNLLVWLALSMLLATALLLDQDVPYPGEFALPVIGAAAILIAWAAQTSSGRYVLGNRWMAGLGLISYPVYLWHWPLLSFLRILSGLVPSVALRAGALVVALVLGWLTWRWIEQPCSRWLRNPRQVWVLSLPLAMLAVLGAVTYDLQGLRSRGVDQLDAVLRPQRGLPTVEGASAGCGLTPAHTLLFADCRTDERGVVRYAVLGDSKASAVFPGLVGTSDAQGRWMVIGGDRMGAPVPLWSDAPRVQGVQYASRLAIRQLAQDPRIEVVLLAAAMRKLFLISDRPAESGRGNGGGTGAYYNHRYLEQLAETPHYALIHEGLHNALAQLVQGGKRVILLVDNPPLPEVQDCVPRHVVIPWLQGVVSHLQEYQGDCVLPLAKLEEQRQLYRQLLNWMVAEFPGKVSLFDPTDIYCPNGRCDVLDGEYQRYSYTDHISAHMARRVGERLNAQLRQGVAGWPAVKAQ